MYYINIENMYNFTPVSNSFIDRYVGSIDNTYVTVYIYVARHAVKGRLPSLKEIAEKFSLSEETVRKIITYWDGEGLFDKPVKPDYSPAEIAKLQSVNPEISGLISSASAILGKALGQKEQSRILSLYDYYNIPMEVIMILLGHCSQSGHTNISYIEKIGLDWAEKGITTSEQAEDYLKLYYGDFTKILKAFGISGRLANSKEKKYMEKWLTEYKLPIEVVIEACESAVINTGKISWKYADTTLSDWFKNDIRDVETARKYAEEHKVKPKKTKTDAVDKSVKPVRVKNKFNNFDEREYDQGELSQLALELLKEQSDET